MCLKVDWGSYAKGIPFSEMGLHSKAPQFKLTKPKVNRCAVFGPQALIRASATLRPPGPYQSLCSPQDKHHFFTHPSLLNTISRGQGDTQKSIECKLESVESPGSVSTFYWRAMSAYDQGHSCHSSLWVKKSQAYFSATLAQ